MKYFHSSLEDYPKAIEKREKCQRKNLLLKAFFEENIISFL